jgi:hypothetical protein
MRPFAVAVFLFLGGCAVQTPVGSSSASMSNTSGKVARTLCFGHLRMRLPSEWELSVANSGVDGHAPRGETLRIINLHRPPSDGQVDEPSAQDRLREFAALKMATVRKIERIKPLQPYSIFALVEFAASSMAAVYEDERDKGNYAIQYLLAEPRTVFMQLTNGAVCELEQTANPSFKRTGLRPAA